MKLVICEKPSVGAAVAAALGVREKKDGYIEGNGYVISWCSCACWNCTCGGLRN